MALPMNPDSEAGADEPARLLHSDLVFNLRDLGGYRGDAGRTIRWRTVFRGDGIHRLPATDLHRDGHPHRARPAHRAPRSPSGAGPTAPGLHWHHLPVLRTIWEPDVVHRRA